MFESTLFLLSVLLLLLSSLLQELGKPHTKFIGKLSSIIERIKEKAIACKSDPLRSEFNLEEREGGREGGRQKPNKTTGRKKRTEKGGCELVSVNHRSSAPCRRRQNSVARTHSSRWRCLVLQSKGFEPLLSSTPLDCPTP